METRTLTRPRPGDVNALIYTRASMDRHYLMRSTNDQETDCRVLWPPIAEGEGCDCTVCVSAEGVFINKFIDHPS